MKFCVGENVGLFQYQPHAETSPVSSVDLSAVLSVICSDFTDEVKSEIKSEVSGEVTDLYYILLLLLS